jgi:hypothetical protein
MAGFGQTAEAQKIIKDEVVEPVEVKKPLHPATPSLKCEPKTRPVLTS